MSDLVEQIDALLALNAKGAVSHPVPGLAVELLERAKAELSLRQSHSIGVEGDVWKLVPAEPTEAMLDAADAARPLPEHYLREAYAAMIAAAPAHKDGEAVAWYNPHNFSQEMKRDYCAHVYPTRTAGETHPLYTHHKEAEVTVTEEMVERALQVWFDQGIVAERSHHQHPVAMRAALVAALSRKG